MIKDVLIHTCCADCFLNSVDYLKEENITNNSTNVLSYFSNPNIHPRSEYVERLNAVKKVLPNDVQLIIPDYRPHEYFESIKGKKKRCFGCWEVRLKSLFQYAKENSFNNITSTLLVSQYQNREEIFKVAQELNKAYSLNFINIDARHNSRRVGFYKQNYCGCCFSLVEKMSS
jgi:predicted adenine nucleotide alpha hydrolase (AANH) superfamily ATPase